MSWDGTAESSEKYESNLVIYAQAPFLSKKLKASRKKETIYVAVRGKDNAKRGNYYAGIKCCINFIS